MDTSFTACAPLQIEQQVPNQQHACKVAVGSAKTISMPRRFTRIFPCNIYSGAHDFAFEKYRVPMSRPTGPQRVRATDPMYLWPQQTPPNNARSQTGGLHKAKAAALQVSATVHSVNLFSTAVVLSDPEVLARGRNKTWIFATCFVVAALTLFILSVSQEQVFRIVVNLPSWEQYTGIAQFYPECPCGNPHTKAGEFVQLNVTPATNFSQNACKPLLRLLSACITTEDFFASNVCTTSDVGALLWANYAEALAFMCYTSDSQLTGSIDGILEAPVGATLLDGDALQNFAARTTLAGLQSFYAATGTVSHAVTAIAAIGCTPAYELTFGAVERTPANCTCHATEYYSPSPSQQHNVGCRFRAAFDSRPGNYSTFWTCDNAHNTDFFPMEIFVRNETYAALGLPPPYDEFTDFVGAEDIAGITLSQFVLNVYSQFFQSFHNGLPNTALLQPGFVTTDFRAHFDTCSPQSCTYVYQDRPTLVAAITTLLGLLSGLQAVLTLLVDRGYDAVFKRVPPTPDDNDGTRGGGALEMGATTPAGATATAAAGTDAGTSNSDTVVPNPLRIPHSL